MKTIYMVGAGHMGGAILLGLKAYFKSATNLRVIEIDTQRLNDWRAKGFETSSQIQALQHQDCVVLAVPPQQFESMLAANPVLCRHRGPVVSVMAGITHATLVRLLGHDAVVRAIPNTPSEVAQGVTMYYAPSDADVALIDSARQIFDVIGLSLRVKDERQIDTGTTLAGGGPALVAHFADALQDHGLHMGLDSEQAAVVALQLLSGTTALIQASGKPARQICQEVQTAGGAGQRCADRGNVSLRKSRVSRSGRSSLCFTQVRIHHDPGRNIHPGESKELPGVFYVSACSGHGFKFAPALGSCLARALAGQSLALQVPAFSRERFAR